MARGKQKNLPSHDHCFRLPLLFSWPKFCFIRFFFLEISNHHHHPFLFVAVAAYHVSTFSSCLQFCGRYCTLIQLMIAGDYTAQPSRPHLVSVSLLPEKPTKWNRIKRNRARSRNNSRVNQPISLQGGGRGRGEQPTQTHNQRVLIQPSAIEQEPADLSNFISISISISLFLSLSLFLKSSLSFLLQNKNKNKTKKAPSINSISETLRWFVPPSFRPVRLSFEAEMNIGILLLLR